MELEKVTLEKLYTNELRIQIHRRNLDAIEIAKVFKHLLEIKKGYKDYRLEKVEAELGIKKKEIYRYMSILKLPEADLKELSKTMTLDKISRVTYNLKEKDKDTITKVVHQLAAKGKNSREVERGVAVINNPARIYEHILADVKRSNLMLSEYIAGINYTELDKDTCKAIRQELHTLMANADRLDGKILSNVSDV